ncbi:L-threonylcarbamoyladenylate synthase [Thermococcus waiotapuensis]|uniref:Threonylcarbamoyl-AMP synthase n=1 Tax=Thermococcus waiotapuensis TaxID=90909 RepID=A0AAE4NU23_9EURY|nr:L-threonylcarbamoyladenylate synthase [Thermococcus waiotapuensis]MDV3103114.1 L-threonylcarbamoyladenylate synthase [Thermococcus waiotapuensis]
MTIVIPMWEGVQRDKLSVAAGILKRGGLVAFPTETVYGLGADALNESATRRIFEAKGRPADNPLIVHIAEVEWLEKLAKEVPEKAWELAEKFWPGPLTIVLPARDTVPRTTTGGLDTVAVRMPAHPIALELIRLSDVPVAAPSANISGRPSPTSADHVIEDFYGKIDCIVDGGETPIGVESTVVDLTSEVPVLLRPGGLPVEELSKVLGEVLIHPALKGEKVDIARSPGMKYKHYSPNAQVIVVEGNREKVGEKIDELVEEYRKKGFRVGVMATEEHDADEFFYLGDSVEEVARNLFKALRELDRRGVNIIIAEGVDERGLGMAVMNRLRKAAGYRVVKV